MGKHSVCPPSVYGMITFPIAKINLGLNVIRRRADGYHDLQTVFYPVNLRDALEVYPMDGAFPSDKHCDIKVSNISIDGDEDNNLVVKAYNHLSAHYTLPRIHIHLHKEIPTQAGLGGGSSDCAYMIKLLNSMSNLGMSTNEMESIAASLGADCAFFINSRPAYAEGIGDRLYPISLDLSGYHICIVRPSIAVSTREAFSLLSPHVPSKCCRDVVLQPIETWKDHLVNDFEQSIFHIHPEMCEIKDHLYRRGAIYASMSGSGSSLFGIFCEPLDLSGEFPDMFCKTIPL